MKRDPEYFPSPVTDEWNTLRPLPRQEQEGTSGQIRAFAWGRNRVRKAFALGAVFLAVLVAVTTTVTPRACPVCGEEGCSYYLSQVGKPAQILSLEALPETKPGESQEPDRLTYQVFALGSRVREDQGDWRFLLLGDGRVAGLSSTGVSSALREKGIAPSSLESTRGTFAGGEGRTLGYGWEEKGELCAYAQLLELPRGQTPNPESAYTADQLEKALDREHTTVFQETSTKGLWLRTYSFTSKIAAQDLLDALSQDYLVGQGADFMELGNNLQAGFGPAFSLTGATLKEVSCSLEEDAEGEGYGLVLDFPVTQYSISWQSNTASQLVGITFGPVDWNQAAAKWNQLYQEASATGHTSCSAWVPLRGVTVNGVTYSVYMNFERTGAGGMFRGHEVYCVPDSQPTCRISLTCRREILQKRPLEQGIPLTDQLALQGDWVQLLSHFYPAPEVDGKNT